MKVGDRIVCIRTSNSGWVVKGRIYDLLNIVECPNCGRIVFDVGVSRDKPNTACGACGHTYILRNLFSAKFFAPIQYNSAMDELLNKEVVEEKPDIPVKEPVKQDQ